jgi:hypothetical protein
MIPVSVMTWPIEATRTPNSACVWIAEATVEGRTNTARWRHGAANELARHLVAAGLADRPMVTPPSWAGGDHDIPLVPCRGRCGPSARANERCAASGTDSRQKGSSLTAGQDKNAFHRRWPVTWRACRPTDVKRRRRRRPSRSVQLFPVLRGRAALLRANQIGAMETSRGAELTGSKRTLPLARILIQPMQAFYCCIVCITVIDAERD